MVARGKFLHDFHPEAERELLAAGRWYADRSESAAIKLYEAIKYSVSQICESPRRWPEYLHSTHKYVVQGLPYLIIYRTLVDRVQIIAVAHTSKTGVLERSNVRSRAH